ncbi:hypothetical protein GOP47_0014706 [Adiantum capillus-veneris]|uniref:Uncharacterized protein n=1 Tax=Adiantum capillus-veneris TaxID=13818 RepID=A0A9D4UM03_ADICA|nr:hypothetical protein GOP47_0014706 [Adiantum capillus-veneris]
MGPFVKSGKKSIGQQVNQALVGASRSTLPCRRAHMLQLVMLANSGRVGAAFGWDTLGAVSGQHLSRNSTRLRCLSRHQQRGRRWCLCLARPCSNVACSAAHTTPANGYPRSGKKHRTTRPRRELPSITKSHSRTQP